MPRPARRLLLACVIALVELAPASVAWAQDVHKQVLVIYSTRRDSEFSTIGESELPRTLDVGLSRNLDYYSEFIDLARFPEPSYKTAFADFIRLKYQSIRFDVVVAMGDVAIEFVKLNREVQFGDTPVVFLANSRTSQVGGNSTGLMAERDFASTLTLIGALQPDVKNIFVVVGAAPSDKAFEQMMRAQVQSFAPRFNFTYLSGLPTPDLERRLGQLPKHSAVYHLLVTEDGAGNRFHPLDYVDRVTDAANAPTYSWVSSTLGHGVVGGYLYDQRDAAHRVGELALRVLRGERADSIPPEVLSPGRNELDARKVQKWGISESRAPARTVISFREPTVWERYKTYIASALAILVMQSVLIGGLLIQRERRRRAENDLRRSQRDLQASYARIRDLGSRLLSAQEAERARIARELHDDISQQLAILTVDLELLGRTGQDQAQLRTGEALSLARSVAQNVHDLSHRLHPARLRLLGLVAAIEALRRELSSSGIAISFTHEGVPPQLPPELTLCLFRIVQEALQNAIKYSRAAEVSVRMRGLGDTLTVSIVDDGVGFDVDATWDKGLGLISMNERLEAVGGTLEILATPGTGCRVTATVPLVHALQAPRVSVPPGPKTMTAH